MLTSMTGFGRATRRTKGLEVGVEVRTLNHRYLEIHVRVPQIYSFVEGNIRKMVKDCMCRGKVDVFCFVKDRREKALNLQLNDSFIKGYLDLVSILNDSYDIKGTLEVQNILSMNGSVSLEEVEEDSDVVPKMMIDSLREALEGVSVMRSEEGTSMENDISRRIDILRALREEISGLSADHKQAMGKRLIERIEEFAASLGKEEIADGRIAGEIALMADKLDIAEELKRIESHIGQFHRCLLAEESTKGRKLDFILQELNREFNTISSKTQSADISGKVVEAKAQLEKIREQVQNIE